MGYKKRILKTNSLSIGLLLFMASCLPMNKVDRISKLNNPVTYKVGINNGKVLRDNPIILSGNPNLSIDAPLDKLASEDFITTLPILQGMQNCQSNSSTGGLFNCYDVKETVNSPSALVATDHKWGFKAHSPEFAQVNSFYHINKSFEHFFANLSNTNLKTKGTNTSIPSNIINGSYYSFFSKPLTIYAYCDEQDNAYFNAASNSLCFGYTGKNRNLLWAHDSSVIYHEFGHFLQHSILNVRNRLSVVKASLGNFLYNEAGAIGEGLSDFYSYAINGRAHFGEWAAGHLDSSRPMTEDDPLHIDALRSDNNSRLRYPEYLNYDANNPNSPIETVHSSGMIISHYLVALTEDLKLKCNTDQKTSAHNVYMLINETLAELGDLTSTGIHKQNCSGSSCLDENANTGRINLNSNYSSVWFNSNNPINYRSFMQTFAKYLLQRTTDRSICPLPYVYTKDNIETLIDSYGLLNFKSYNQHRNLTSAINTNTAVSAINRQKTTLIDKSNLILDPEQNSPTAFVIDSQKDIKNSIINLQASGVIKDISPQIDAGLGHNNSNGQINLGEVVGIALNLYNNSNATMGGIQILANDWKHANKNAQTGKLEPCQIQSNYSAQAWPTIEEGASETPCLTPSANFTPDDFAPVCFMQSIEGTSSKWISQEEFMYEKGASESICLDSTNPKDCYLRAIKGADTAYYSKILPKKTWLESMYDVQNGKSYSPSLANILLFEVSKHIPHGTTFNCRLRVRFTNCSNCYNEPDSMNDFHDKEYNGHKPFNIIHLNFTVRE